MKPGGFARLERMKGLPRLAAGIVLCALLKLAWTGAAGASPAGVGRWEEEIRAFERSDRTNPPPPGAVWLVGSSSIRLWTNAAAHFPGHVVVRRGLGGAHIREVTDALSRLVLPYGPRVIVLYAGDNDVAEGLTAEAVLQDFRRFVERVRSEQPAVPVVYLAIKPSPARLRWLEVAREANQRIRAWCESQSGVRFVDVFTPMLDSAGRPRSELFVADGLHMNESGYRLWAERLGPVLEELAPPRPERLR